MARQRDRWGWTEAFEEGFCLVLAGGLSAAGLVSRFSPEPVAVAVSEPDEAVGEGWVRAGVTGGWAFALELSSAQGSRPEVLRELSRDSEVLGLLSLPMASLLRYCRPAARSRGLGAGAGARRPLGTGRPDPGRCCHGCADAAGENSLLSTRSNPRADPPEQLYRLRGQRHELRALPGAGVG